MYKYTYWWIVETDLIVHIMKIIYLFLHEDTQQRTQ